MSQNRSSAVMQQRSEPHDSLDDFPTPPWAVRALCEWAVRRHDIEWQTVREPAANRGFMMRALGEHFAEVIAADVHDYGCGLPVEDYLFGPLPAQTGWTITNPPFRLAEEFIRRALLCSDNVAMLVRSAFLEGVGRHRDLFRVQPPSDILHFVERVPMVKGRYDPRASTATAYVWLVWDSNQAGVNFGWIAPCRARLERPGDAVLPTAVELQRCGLAFADGTGWDEAGE